MTLRSLSMPRTACLASSYQVLVTACAQALGHRARLDPRIGLAMLASVLGLIAIVTAQCGVRSNLGTGSWTRTHGAGTIAGFIVAIVMLQAVLRRLQRKQWDGRPHLLRHQCEPMPNPGAEVFKAALNGDDPRRLLHLGEDLVPQGLCLRRVRLALVDEFGFFALKASKILEYMCHTLRRAVTRLAMSPPQK